MTGAARPLSAVAMVAAVALVLALPVLTAETGEPRPSGVGITVLEQRACNLPAVWLRRVQRGYHPRRSGQISILPRTPSYMASGAGGWSHSGPWGYLQRVPLLFHAPGLRAREVDRPVTLADVAPSLGRLLGLPWSTPDGHPLPELTGLRRPRLVVTVVLDGGGWNTLERWPDAWPFLRSLFENGLIYRAATVGSSPSVTPAVHTTLGSGVFPRSHAITGVPVFDDDRAVVDAFLDGSSGRFLEAKTLAEAWDEATDGVARVSMIGYEPWHLGMIGIGAERPGGDRDDAVWLDVETNEWITAPAHYSLPRSIASTPGLDEDIRRLDAADGAIDGAWGEHEILDLPDRIEETPAFVAYHARALLRSVELDGYGDDEVTDLMFTNFKQIDRVGHYFNMSSEEVRQSIVATDEALRRIVRGIDRTVDDGKWLLVVTADHGQQPDASVLDAHAVDPNEVRADIDAAFGGPVTIAVWPTEVFLDEAVMAEMDVTVDQVAAWLGAYRARDNVEPGEEPGVAPQTPLFDLVLPADRLPSLDCGTE